MQRIALFGLVGCWVLWFCPFVLHRLRAPRRKPHITVSTANWGLLLQVAGYGVAWFPVAGPKPAALLAGALLLAALAIACAWASVRHLGKQLRIRAGLYPDHELIRTGPYRLVRHPIYGSMLAMFVVTALVRSAWPVWLAGLVIFVAGTEIRVRTEDKLLASRFGAEFAAYKAKVAAYVPFVR